MNNAQFRNLILEKDKKDRGSATTTGAAPSSAAPRRAGIVPMTPRAIKGSTNTSFVQQMRERNNIQRPSKKYKTSAPKGVKYGKDYTDRAKARAEDDGEDEKEKRIAALEEQMKLEQISPETFEQLRDQITGGDIGATHLVKGLDRRLLERVRRGEDVLGNGGGGKEAEALPDVDDALDEVADKEVKVVEKVKAEKKGTFAPAAPVAGKKRTRDEIMAELKAQRAAAAAAKAAPVLGRKWRKVGEQQKSRIEVDSKGREVNITVDEDGVVKKKVRKARPGVEQESEEMIAMPDAGKEVLGADVVVPEAKAVPQPQEDEDDDIFEGVGAEYNPLGDDDSDSGSERSDTDHPKISAEEPSRAAPDVEDDGDDDREAEDSDIEDGEVISSAAPGGAKDTTADVDDQIDNGHGQTHDKRPAPAPARRNYFTDHAPSAAQEEESAADRQAALQNLLKKAANLDPSRFAESEDAQDKAEAAKRKRHAEMLGNRDRDMDDTDMGFGGDRFDPDDDGGKVKISKWGEDDGDAEDGGKSRGEKKKRERKPKKRKVDVNSAAEIFRVIEERKKSAAS